MSTLDTVKMRKRIKHSKLDSDIETLIDTAKAEMIRVGCDEGIVNAGGSLVTQAVVTYCLMNMEKEKDLIDRYEKAFAIQIDGIRKSSKVDLQEEPQTEDDDV